MKKSILSVLFVLLVATSSSQSMSMIWTGGVYDAIGSFPGFGESIVLDASGNSYTTGSFSGTMDFDPGVGVYNLASAGSGSSVFILKLDASGNFVWAKSFSGGVTASALCYSIALDDDGNIFTAGDFTGTVDFDPGAGIANLTVAGLGSFYDIFTAKLDPSGNYLWAKRIGAANEDNALAIAVDRSGSLYTTGIFRTTVDFDPGPGTYTASVTTGGLGIYLMKLDSLGNFLWAKTMVGSSGPDGGQGHGVVTDRDNNVYYTGHFNGTLDFDPGPGTFNMSTLGPSSHFVFVSKLDSLGNFVWAKKMGGAAVTYARSITIDTANNIYTTGWFNGTTDFDTGAGVFNLIGTPNHDVFISKIDSIGDFVWAKKIGGSQQEESFSVVVDSNSNVYTTGGFTGFVDFDPGASTFFMTSSSGGVDSDIFISKLDSLGNFEMAVHIGGNASVYAKSIQVDEFDNVFITGSYVGTTDFEPGPGVYNMSTPSTNGAFVEKLHQSLLGINELSQAGQISIYPNPTSSSFTLFTSEQIKNGSIEIYNRIGSLVLNQKITSQQNAIDLKNFATGIYFVKVMSEGKIVGMQKVVKQ